MERLLTLHFAVVLPPSLLQCATIQRFVDATPSLRIVAAVTKAAFSSECLDVAIESFKTLLETRQLQLAHAWRVDVDTAGR